MVRSVDLLKVYLLLSKIFSFHFESCLHHTKCKFSLCVTALLKVCFLLFSATPTRDFSVLLSIDAALDLHRRIVFAPNYPFFVSQNGLMALTGEVRQFKRM